MQKSEISLSFPSVFLRLFVYNLRWRNYTDLDLQPTIIILYSNVEMFSGFGCITVPKFSLKFIIRGFMITVQVDL